ncbi:MAG TPA: alpha/beta fold hydrolase, partial [Rhodospirillales bacterium]|nr:alpha/beta fold hydrolase [Rhodospirillales bacterium]
DIGYHQLLDDLARQGIATVRYEKFDQRASNPVEAEGAIDFPTLCRDAERWLEWLDGPSWADDLPRFLIGHSMGGTVALSLSAEHSEISTCLLLSAPGRPLRQVIDSQAAWNQEHAPSSNEANAEAQRMRRALLDALALDGEWTEDNVDKKLLPMKHKRRFLKSVIHIDPCDFVSQASCPLIVVRGTADVQVFAEDADLLLDAAERAGRPVEFIEAEDLDHLLKRNRKTGLDALAAYRDRRRRIPIALIRRIAKAVGSVIGR